MRSRALLGRPRLTARGRVNHFGDPLAPQRCCCCRSGWAAIGWLSGRVLGIRIGRWRSGVAGVDRLVPRTRSGAWRPSCEPVGTPTLPGRAHPVWRVLPGVLATLPVAIVLDLVLRRPPRTAWRAPAPVASSRPQRARRPGAARALPRARRQRAPGEPPRALPVGGRRCTPPDLARRRAGLVLERSRRDAREVRPDRGSTCTDLLPSDDDRRALQALHADVEPAPRRRSWRAVLERSSAEPAERAFREFPTTCRSPPPRWARRTGRGSTTATPVVVKVQRPGMRTSSGATDGADGRGPHPRAAQ